jgi:hypothetical protein
VKLQSLQKLIKFQLVAIKYIEWVKKILLQYSQLVGHNNMGFIRKIRDNSSSDSNGLQRVCDSYEKDVICYVLHISDKLWNVEKYILADK